MEAGIKRVGVMFRHHAINRDFLVIGIKRNVLEIGSKLMKINATVRMQIPSGVVDHYLLRLDTQQSAGIVMRHELRCDLCLCMVCFIIVVPSHDSIHLVVAASCHNDYIFKTYRVRIIACGIAHDKVITRYT